jgi:hypothetical protein
MNKPLRLVHADQHDLAEELIAVLAESGWCRFKPLFVLVHERLRARHATHGSEETLRLQAYLQLQTMVRHGVVERSGQSYRGRQEELAALNGHAAADHCRDLLSALERLVPERATASTSMAASRRAIHFAPPPVQ